MNKFKLYILKKESVQIVYTQEITRISSNLRSRKYKNKFKLYLKIEKVGGTANRFIFFVSVHTVAGYSGDFCCNCCFEMLFNKVCLFLYNDILFIQRHLVLIQRHLVLIQRHLVHTTTSCWLNIFTSIL